jgi:tyrosyl-tRNA synthetase
MRQGRKSEPRRAAIFTFAATSSVPARVNDEKVEDERRTLSPTDLRGDVVKLSLGRKKHALLKVV